MKRIHFFRHVLFVFILLLATTTFAAETKLTWFGHAAFQITTPTGKVLMIDPWLNNPLNPAAKDKKDAVQAIEKTDFILVSHGHFDHISDAVALGKKTGAHLVTNLELGSNMVRLMGFPSAQAGFDTLMNAGGEIKLDDGNIVIAMTPAVHSSGLDFDATGKQGITYGGNPVGFIIKIKDGPTFYHTGDTAYFKDMDLIGENYHPDVALINIGGHFGMEPEMAAKAAGAVKAKLVIPHHYKTFPVLTQDPKDFFAALDKKKIAHQEMTPGSTLVFDGKKLKKE